MGVHDLDARFDALSPGSGTIAESAIDAIHRAAKDINDQVAGEPYQLVTVLQALETAAHQALGYLDFAPDDQPGMSPAEPEDPYEGLTVEGERGLKTLAANRGLPVSGTRAELIARLREWDEENLGEPAPPQA